MRASVLFRFFFLVWVRQHTQNKTSELTHCVLAVLLSAFSLENPVDSH